MILDTELYGKYTSSCWQLCGVAFKEAFQSVEGDYCADIPDEEVFYVMSNIYVE